MVVVVVMMMIMIMMTLLFEDSGIASCRQDFFSSTGAIFSRMPFSTSPMNSLSGYQTQDAGRDYNCLNYRAISVGQNHLLYTTAY